MTENDMEVDSGPVLFEGGSRRPPIDFDAMIRELRSQPIKNPCPRGKVIKHPLQARYLYFDISQEDSMSSTLSSVNEDSVGPAYGTPRTRARRLTTAEQRDLDQKLLKERQQQYHEQEMALGGYHDVFNDPCPEFKPRNFVRDDSTSEDDSQVEDQNPASDSQDDLLNNTLTGDDVNVVISSQGRVGQGCSTPQSMADHTFAPLRKIDVSIVKCSESVSSDRQPLAESHTVTVTSTEAANTVEQTGTVKRKAIPANKSRTSGVEANAGRNDSMEDVLSKMQKTPKRPSSNAKRSTLNVTSKRAVVADNSHEEEDVTMTCAVPEAANGNYSVQQANGTYVVQKDGTFVVQKDGTFVVQKDGTYVVEAAAPNGSQVQQQQNATFTIEQTESVQPFVHENSAVGSSKATNSQEPVFAVPALPKRTTRNTAKTTVEQREKRMNTSQKKNASILEMMDLDIPSPGRTLFAALPSKKQRTLTKTPVKAKTLENEDAMEVSIAMSDISQQPSLESGDDSVVDPVSDPRPAQATPTRAPGFSRRLRNTPDVPLIASQSVQGSPANKKGNKTPFADLSPRSRQAALKESVDRLSRPRNAEGARCNREWKRQEGKEAVRKVLGSPMVGTARGSNLQAPVTPFQPLDASRMTIVNAERSGTVRRGPSTRLRLDGTSLFPEEISAPKHKNLLKRLGDYKPQQNVPSRLSPPQSVDTSATERASQSVDTSATERAAQPVDASATQTSPQSVDASATERDQRVGNTPMDASTGGQALQSTLRSPVIDSPPGADSAMSSAMGARDQSSRATAGKNAALTTSPDVLANGYENSLTDAARQLSLEDISPASADQEGEESTIVIRKQKPQRLLTDSLYSTDTPHRAPHDPYKRPLDSFDEGVGAVSSEESTTVPELSLIEVEGGRGAGRTKLEPMILKPRKVVHPAPPPDPSVRRSARNRMKPVRQWLGEQPVYAVSPGGSRTLQGVTEVEVREQRWLRVRTVSYNLAMQREQQIAAHKRALREQRRQEARERKQRRLRELRARHRRGLDLEITVDSIVTSSDEEDSD